jgi:hypothetical protein
VYARAAALKKLGPFDAVHCHYLSVVDLALGRVMARQQGAPLAATFWGSDLLRTEEATLRRMGRYLQACDRLTVFNPEHVDRIRRLYGEDIAPAAYEILLNVHDRDTFGEELLAKFKKTMYGKLPDEALAKVKLSADTVRISGGLILRCGAVEENCSLAMLFAHVRRETEAKISRLLWGEVQ